MTDGNISGLLVQHHYDDIGEWGREVGWDFDCQQLESGNMAAFAAAFGTPHCMAMRGEFSCGFRQVGSPPKGMVTLGFPDQEVDEFDWCGKMARGGDIVNFSLENGFEGTTPAGFSGFAVSISEELLTETAASLGIGISSLKAIKQNSVWRGNHHASKELRQQFSITLGSARTHGGHKAINFFSQATAGRILQLVSGTGTADIKDSLKVRSRTARRALDCIESTKSVTLTVADLCKHTGVSAPTLYRCFEEKFGIGPKRFIHVQCLSGVRKDLLTTDASFSISNIANKWGFWHMGQFAADYKKCFGELPSDTRRLRKTGS
jgi:AraC family ethanolamine operon transcriptional activator